MEKSSELLKECTEKIKVSSTEIVVHGTREKPYYEIKYHDLSDGQTHVGYSSYNLDFVFEWLEECFEIINQAADTTEALSEKLQVENMDNGGGWIACKDRLPDIECDVLLSLRSLDIYTGFRANTEGMFYVEGEGYVEYENVLAWQPLPEPYRP